MLFKNHPVHEARSAGTSEKARTRVNEKLLLWADVIFAMERRHRQLLNERFPSALVNKQLVILEIEDDYPFGDAELIEILKEKLTDYL
jgi:protein-tyrosine phosphatase